MNPQRTTDNQQPTTDNTSPRHPPRLYSESEARREASRCLTCGDPTCMQGCPTKVNVQEFVREIATGNLTRSARLLLSRNPLYWSCAYVCPVEEQCEKECHNADINYPVTIGRLQQFVASRDQDSRLYRPEFPEAIGRNIAVIGAGPAGLACAWQLARYGIRSVVYEKREDLGGMLGWAIPAYRLPNEIRDPELARLISPLTEVRLGTAAGKATGLLQEGYDAIFVAPGLQDSARARLPGEENARFALEFLDAGHRGTLDCNDETVIVIGGGNVAMDVCGTAIEYGARKVEILCLEAPNEMPSSRRELEEAWQSGVIFNTRLMPKAIVVEQGNVAGVRATAIEWNEPGKLVPSNARELPGTERLIPGTMVVEAVGQSPAPDLDAVLEGIDRTRGLVTINEETMATSVAGIYAGGDIVNGGSTVAWAVDHANRAAQAIAEQVGATDRS